MSREVHFEAEAQVELEEAMQWYEQHRDGLGDALLDAVDATLLRVVEMPSSFPRMLQARPACSVRSSRASLTALSS